MKATLNIFKFVLIDNLKSVWGISYALFVAASTLALVHFTGSFTRSVVSIMNIVILLTPLISTTLMSMYYFNKTDFLHLLLSQPVKRWSVFFGMYLGVSVTLCLALVVGLGLGMVLGYQEIEAFKTLWTLMLAGVFLTLIFCAIALFLSVLSKDKLRGIGLALAYWLFMAVIFDGLLLMYFIAFSEYPIEEHAIAFTLFNPIDLSRVFIMLQLDVSALLGYSGAVFQKFFGTWTGIGLSILALVLWIVLPLLGLSRTVRRKDY